MSVDAEGERTGEMALAFELEAIRRFADPAAVFADAREWSRYVGVVANDTDAVAEFVAGRDLDQDFELGDSDIWLAMEGIRESSDAPRHVYVGETAEARRVAQATGWEHRTPEAVADAAGWSLGRDDASAPGLLARLLSRFGGGPEGGDR
ncbi:MAG: hypothetical protein ABEJ26_09140 [Halosimplex sp.]